MRNFLSEFKAFAVRGNVVDLAVAVIIGAAFGKIVSSRVDTIVMPLLGIILGSADFSGLVWHIGTTAVRYGVFLQSVVDFVIISLVIFVAIRMINKLVKHEEAKAEQKPAPIPDDVRLLTEIRDLLKK